jgi:hypothetical protein
VHDIVGGTNHVLDLTVLWESVETRHPKLDVVREEESAGGGVIKHASIITLDALDGAANCVGMKAKKWERVRKVLDFWHSRKVHEYWVQSLRMTR